MGKFKVGDRVRVLHTDFQNEQFAIETVHEVTDLSDDVIFLKCIDGCTWPFYEEELELIQNKTIQLNQPYTSKNGTKWECVGIKGGVAWMARDGDGDAYRFLLNGENLSQGGGLWDIEWEPIVEWVETKGGWSTVGLNPQQHHVYNIRFPLIDGKPDFTQATVTPV